MKCKHTISGLNMVAGYWFVLFDVIKLPFFFLQIVRTHIVPTSSISDILCIFSVGRSYIDI